MRCLIWRNLKMRTSTLSEQSMRRLQLRRALTWAKEITTREHLSRELQAGSAYLVDSNSLLTPRPVGSILFIPSIKAKGLPFLVALLLLLVELGGIEPPSASPP